MIVYREEHWLAPANEILSGLCVQFREFEGRSQRSHEAAQRLLIDFGEFEAGLTDAVMTGPDMPCVETRAARRAAVALGRIFYCTSRDRDCGGSVERAGRALSDLTAIRLPSTIKVSVPEGYAHYGLYPEAYLEAAVQFMQERNPMRAVVIGIRSIGTSLSAAVAGALEENGCRVLSHTVRPQGHPFDRTLRTADTLDCDWMAQRTSEFLIVDEGPGISGSSFGCVAEKLSKCGVLDERVSLFPSWEAAPEALANNTAREQWMRHRRYVGAFHRPWLEDMRDLSAGQWREVVYASGDLHPAVQPQHEARKYLANAGVLIKFAGIGRYGDRKLPRARELAEAGFTPSAIGCTSGFIATDFVKGVPLTAADRDCELLDRIAEYAAFRARAFPASRSVRFETMVEMIETNIFEATAGEVNSPLLSPVRDVFDDRPAVEVDGRMMPHEWLRTERGILKTDAVDHHADHFFPGCADIAWDLAGAAIEFQLRPAERQYLLERYTKESGDRIAPDLMEFYTTAYLAFRAGYAALAAQATSGTPDSERFATLQSGYSGLLQPDRFEHNAQKGVLIPA
jgi:hypothetical protein